jgi:hypothetical protein
MPQQSIGENCPMQLKHASLSKLMYTHHSHTMPEGAAGTSQIFFRDAQVLQNDLAMRNTVDVTGGKPIAVSSQSISGVSAINPLVAFYDIHGTKREVLIFYLTNIII